MLDTIFLTVLDMTRTGSIVIAVILAARLLLKRAPKLISYALWAVALFRLLCPVGLQAPVSVLPELKPVEQSYGLAREDIPLAAAGGAAVQVVKNAIAGEPAVYQVPTTRMDAQGEPAYVAADPGDILLFLARYIWAAGLGAMLAYSLVSFLRLKRKLREAVPLEDRVYEAGGIGSPFVIGLLRPRIYLPQGLGTAELSYILAHERQHIRRGDPVWKALGFLALSIHWFNPLVWLAFCLACRDMEMSCDEAVVHSLGGSVRAEYSATLLTLATGKRIIAGTPLAFGEGDPKGRIRNLARWKKPILWVSIAAAVACAVLAVCLLTDPAAKKESLRGRTLHFGTVEAMSPEGSDPAYPQGQGSLTLRCEDGSALVFWYAEGFAPDEGIRPGDHVMVRGSYREELQLHLTSRVAVTKRSLSGSLDEAIRLAILGEEGEVREENKVACASFVTLSKESQGIITEDAAEERVELVTVYGMALHQVYELRNGTLHNTSGSHIPVAITFRVSDGGEYVLSEYWMPRDGAYYAQDIRQKFSALTVPDTQDYIEQQQEACLAQARAYFGMQENVLETIPPTTQTITVPSAQGPALPSVTESYSVEDAIRDGVAVMMDGNAYANAENWEEFLLQVEAGQPASVRIMECGTGSQNYLEELRYDGEIFQLYTLCYVDGKPAGILHFDYPTLHRYEGAYYTCYGLSWQDNNWDFEPHWSKRNGSGNPVMVFQYKEDVPSNPRLPEKLVSARLMLEDTVFGQIEEGWRTRSLEEMLRQAEFVPRISEDAFLKELYLMLEFSNGTQLQLAIQPENDWMLLNGLAYDYGPGKVPYEDGQRNRNAILDMVRLFGLEDWPDAFSQWCMDRGMEPPGHSLKVIVGEEPHD